MNTEQERAEFEAWLQTHCDYDDLNKSEIELARDAWQAAIEADRKRQGDSAKVLAELVALIPLADTLNASASCQDLIDYFKGVIADRKRRGEPKGATYTVGMNHCQCHPETCCCNDYAIYDDKGNKHSTHFYESVAKEVAAALNMSAPQAGVAEQSSAADGLKIVPVNPTPEMIQRGLDAFMGWDENTDCDIGIWNMYSAMLKAAPQPAGAAHE